MNIETFAKQHRLTTRKDSCGELIIPGKPRNVKPLESRCHIFEYDKDTLGIYLGVASVGKWNNRRKAALASGFVLSQDGDDEGIVLFNPENPKQAKLAIKMVGCREKAVLSPERLAELSERGKRLAGLRRA